MLRLSFLRKQGLRLLRVNPGSLEVLILFRFRGCVNLMDLFCTETISLSFSQSIISDLHNLTHLTPSLTLVNCSLRIRSGQQSKSDFPEMEKCRHTFLPISPDVRGRERKSERTSKNLRFRDCACGKKEKVNC